MPALLYSVHYFVVRAGAGAGCVCACVRAYEAKTDLLLAALRA
jgi:hypothetical protein